MKSVNLIRLLACASGVNTRLVKLTKMWNSVDLPRLLACACGDTHRAWQVDGFENCNSMPWCALLACLLAGLCYACDMLRLHMCFNAGLEALLG